MTYLPVKQMHEFMIAVFSKIGVPIQEAKICADVLIASDLRGIESHGIGRLKMYYDRIKSGIQSPETKIDVIKDRYATAVWDGNHGMGHVIAHKAMQEAIDKAKLYGLGSVAVRNSTHYGICGYYADMATGQDMIGLNFTNARPSICPTHGVAPMLGTNPICFGAPTNLPYPFIYDAATSISQRGKVEQYAREEKPTPPFWAINRQGEVQTDTQKLLKDLVDQSASMLPLGGTEEVTGSHKGYGLGTMVEILCAALQNGSYLNGLWGRDADGKPAPYRLGHFFLAINIDFYTELEDFKKISTDICKQLQASELFPGRDRIWVAGEKEYENELKVREQGIRIVPNLAKNIRVMQEELGLSNIDI
ncbi:MAG: Ldh family oxidoreductase [Candidatus Cloacimonadaceae bacterium]|jgi:LDH2 family malate/lactate/ureidoglycolate dehydrogenase|nr:Ldh family oxidoreductase [Candidatus Cloacimonadota bacterium]MDY0127097.1 Ldh family oxidoreductase [Candidatus Cloacimonadaceae bacterium]MCB5255706.1 Ldh family oxidoreductase [Candidatus Cloacimonadota bacterium]MCK9177780.1 Ldh family oxidoreductase [Candidatus Cloacimonadota bacterium]MCK9241746.1 Ldh family oxidoreductase [Candidatus Cloacimonadota bacterium]